jgi:S1-C subfamily serine protease
VDYVERDVSRDPSAAREAMSRSGQTGVPVTVDGSDVIVGFDRARLTALVQRWKTDASSPPRLGVAARDFPGGGAEVGRVNPGQPGEQAGVQVGDVITAVNDTPVDGVDDLMRKVNGLPPRAPYFLNVARNGQQRQISVRP